MTLSKAMTSRAKRPENQSKEGVVYENFPAEALDKKKNQEWRSEKRPNKADLLLSKEQRKRARIKRTRWKRTDQRLPGFFHIGYWYTPNPWYSGVRIYDTSWALSKKRVDNFQWCSDTIRNPYYVGELDDKGRVKRPYDDGGDFVSYKIHWTESPGAVTFTTGTGRDHYAYSLPASTGGSAWGIDLDTSMVPPSGDLHSFEYGAEAWNKAKPVQLRFGSLLNAIFELKDIRSMLSKKASDFLHLGENYLDYQFGWKPFISDVKNFISSYQMIDKQVRFILANRDKPVRRRVMILDDTTHETIFDSTGYPNHGLWATNEILAGYDRKTSAWHKTCVAKTTKRVWFSGEFLFSFNGKTPPREDLERRIRGLVLTPATVYNAIPWSWLEDWLTNVGDVISNISAEIVDSQVSTYAYVMKHTKREVTWSGTDGYWSASVKRTFDTKVRQKANPFGLAVNVDAFTPRQQLILASIATSGKPHRVE